MGRPSNLRTPRSAQRAQDCSGPAKALPPVPRRDWEIMAVRYEYCGYPEEPYARTAKARAGAQAVGSQTGGR